MPIITISKEALRNPLPSQSHSQQDAEAHGFDRETYEQIMDSGERATRHTARWRTIKRGDDVIEQGPVRVKHRMGMGGQHG